MNTEKTARIEKLSTIRRLPVGLNKLYELKGRGVATITLSEFAVRMNLDDTVIQNDLVVCGAAKRTDVGFRIDQLINTLEEYLKTVQPVDAVFVCGGLLGEILLRKKNFAGLGVNVLATFLTETVKKTVDEDENIFPLEKLTNLTQRLLPEVGILCVPHKLAQEATELLIHAGVTEIWNWSGTEITVPSNCAVFQEEIVVPEFNLFSITN